MVIYEIQYSNDDYRKVKNPNIVNARIFTKLN